MKPSANKVMGPLEWFWLIILSLIWGGSFFFGKVALAELRPLTIVLGRVGIAAIALNLFVVMAGHRMPPSMKVWGLFLIMGTLNNIIPFSLIFWGKPKLRAALRRFSTPIPDAKTWGALIALALLCTAVAYVVYFRLLATAGATNLLLVTFLIPISALFLGMTILGEHLDLRHFVGMGLIGLGLAAIDGRILTRIRMRFLNRKVLSQQQIVVVPQQPMDDYRI